MPEPRVELLLVATRQYLAMLDACAVITALMKRPENNFQLTVGRWKFNLAIINCRAEVYFLSPVTVS